MIGQLQILTYLLAFYLVVKGIEVLQVGLASSKDNRRGVISLGLLTLAACVVAAIGFVWMQEVHVLGLDRTGLSSNSAPSTYSRSSSVPTYTAPSQEERRRQEAITEAHNKGWYWAQERRPNAVNDCGELDDADVRDGCESWVKAYRK